MIMIFLNRSLQAAGLLILLFLASPVDAATDRGDNQVVYRTADRHPPHADPRPRHSRRHGGGVVTVTPDDPVSVPDGGSTLAMIVASTALLLLGYHRLKYKPVASWRPIR